MRRLAERLLQLVLLLFPILFALAIPALASSGCDFFNDNPHLTLRNTAGLSTGDFLPPLYEGDTLHWTVTIQGDSSLDFLTSGAGASYVGGATPASYTGQETELGYASLWYYQWSIDGTGSIEIDWACFPGASITTQPSNSTISAYTNTTFSIQASDADGYQWMVSTDSGNTFSPVADGGVYSGATTPTLTITGATTGMSGYQYRADVHGVYSNITVSSDTAELTVNWAPASQTITFADPGPQSFGTTPTLTANASSNLAVSFSSSTPGVCTISSGGVLSFVSAGTCTVNADQAGDGAYLAAATVTRSFTVNAALPGAPTIGSATAGNGEATVSFGAPSSTGGGHISGYTVLSSPGGIAATGSSSPVLVTGLTNGVTYTFTVAAINSAGTGAASAASNPVTPAAAVPAPIANAVRATVAANSSVNPVALRITGGTATAVAVVSAASHGAARASGTAITYTPAAGYSGPDSFTYVASNASGTSAEAIVSITVAAPTVILSPPGGSLPEAMAGEAYRQQVSVQGATAPATFHVASGRLPPGLALNASTGELTGMIEAGSEGDYRFTIQVRDARNAVGMASYTMHVRRRAVTVQDITVDVPAGTTPARVDLAAGATGGPFISAELVFVEPANAGTVSIVRSASARGGAAAPGSWYLLYASNPSYSGELRVGFRLASTLGVSNIGTVTYRIGFDPLTVASEIDSLVHGFVKTRQGMIASTLKVPGLIERHQMARATDPVTTRMMPSSQGLTLGFSTSLAQMEAARSNGDEELNAEVSPFNVWADGMLMAHNRGENGDTWGNFAMVSAGIDYLLSEEALIGLSIHYDRMTDPTDKDATLTGNGWLAGPYGSFEIARGVFWDTSLLYGGSSNEIDTLVWDGHFDTTQWMVDTSISGQWNLDAITTLTPTLRAVYFSETVQDYAIANGGGDVLDLQGFTEEQLRVSLGAEIARQFLLGNNMMLTPKLGVTGGFSGLDGTGAFGQVSANVSLASPDSWSLDAGLLFMFSADDEKSVGAKAGVSRTF